MTRLMLVGFFALILSITLSVQRAGASEPGLSIIPNASFAFLGKTGPMATGGAGSFWEWLRITIRRVFSQIREYHDTPKGSVPIPGTLLLFGGGFVALISWRWRHPPS